MKVKLLSRVQLFMTPWAAAYQAPPSMGFSRQEHWSGVPSPSPYISGYITNNDVICDISNKGGYRGAVKKKNFVCEKSLIVLSLNGLS